MPVTKIYGREFEVPSHYAEGYTLTAKEAEALNSLRAELVGHRVRSFAKDHVTDGAVSDEIYAQMQAKFIEGDAQFEFNAARQPREEVDPVTREARVQAGRDIRKTITAAKDAYPNGLQKADEPLAEGMYPRDRYEELVDRYSQEPAYIKKAKAIVRARAGDVSETAISI